LIAAVIVLLIALRRPEAAFIPIVNAIFAVGCGLAIVSLLGRIVLIPNVAPTLGTMIGLGVGIDYALFLVTRHRVMLLKGFEVADSAGRTAGTAGAGMVFAGSTLILAVCGLSLTGISFLAWLGYSAAIVVAVAVAASLTLVPAIFGLLGKRVLRKKQVHAIHEGDTHLDEGFWARIADSVTTRPWRYAVTATVVLLILASPMASMSFGQADDSALPPDTTAYQANEMMVDAFGPGSVGPLLVVVQMNRAAEPPKNAQLSSGSGDPRAQDPRLTRLAADLAETPGIENVSPPYVSPDGGVAGIKVTPTTGPADPATQALVETLRAEALPQDTKGQDMNAHVGGLTALQMDLTGQIGERLPYFIIGVATLSAMLLMVAYRSLVIPIKAAAMNLISISAAYGVVVAIFQWGWGAHLIGIEELVPIESYVPMMMFAVLFGLSMDYEVFLLTSFQEHWSRTGNMVTSVRRGLTDTGQVVTSAASIMIVVFASFILVPNAIVKMFGIGLSTAVLVDATIVRCILVPALMVLAAKWTWWLPKWLNRTVPHLHVEGDPSELESIHRPPDEPPPETTDATARPSTPLLPILIGVFVAWFVGSRMRQPADSAPFQDVAIAVAALGGGLAVWLPRSLAGSGRLPGVRILVMLCGAVCVGIGYGILGIVIAPVAQVPGRMAAWALLGTALLATLPKLRSYGLPLMVGAIIMTVTFASSAAESSGSAGDLVLSAMVPAALAGTVALLVRRIMDSAKDSRDYPAERKSRHRERPTSVSS
ncbi:MAG: MMPL family transporter, partial [Candidatus Nanopelagicales bacterium]|nr:MMPL family transporter [Candidatus Nanopelagicales bacterium]